MSKSSLIATTAKRIAVWKARMAARSTLGVRAMVLDPTGRVLLLRHTYVPGWYFPGGGVEAGETAEEAAVREIAEETAVILAEPPRLASMHLNPPVSARDHVAFFVGRAATGSARARPGEIAEVGFFAPDALPDGVSGATARRIVEVIEGRRPDRLW